MSEKRSANRDLLAYSVSVPRTNFVWWVKSDAWIQSFVIYGKVRVDIWDVSVFNVTSSYLFFDVWTVGNTCLLYLHYETYRVTSPIKLSVVGYLLQHVLWSLCKSFANSTSVIIDCCHDALFSILDKDTGGDRRVLQKWVFVTYKQGWGRTFEMYLRYRYISSCIFCLFRYFRIQIQMLMLWKIINVDTIENVHSLWPTSIFFRSTRPCSLPKLPFTWLE